MLAIWRIIVGLSGSSRTTCLRCASAQRRPTIKVRRRYRFMPGVPAGGELAYRRCPAVCLLEVGERTARQLMDDALAAAFGGVPADVDTQPVIAGGEVGRVLAGVAEVTTGS